MKLPQLRIIATNFCACRCIYCRPSGEGTFIGEEHLSCKIEDVLEAARIYKICGGKEIKISGGDPIFWGDLVKCVKQLHEELGFTNIEVITRSPLILHSVDQLIEAGMSTLNFSLDTIDRDTYKYITGKNDFDEYISVIKKCAKKTVMIKINAVVMKDINNNKVFDLLNFCEQNGVKQLKLLDVIDDMHDSEVSNAQRLEEVCSTTLHDLYCSLGYIIHELKKIAENNIIVTQGGLGHPMNKFTLSSGLEILIKDAGSGAWYGSECKDCVHYPCHDALMALRLTPDKKLQVCLLNDKNKIDFDVESKEEAMRDALKVYEEAYFFK